MSEPRVDLSSKLTQLSLLVDAYAEEGANKTEIQERMEYSVTRRDKECESGIAGGNS